MLNKKKRFINSPFGDKVKRFGKKLTSAMRRMRERKYIHTVARGHYDPTSIDCRYMML